MNSEQAYEWLAPKLHTSEREALDVISKDAERYRKLCEVPGALDAFTAAYHNTQTKEQIDAAVDEVPAVGAA